MNIIFLGPPGSGKGTQSKRLVSSHGFTHLSTGDVFRDAIASDSALGKQIGDLVHNGQLVPDTLVSEVVFEKLRKGLPNTQFLLDGYPRTVDQAKALDVFAADEKMSLDAIFYFEVDEAELVKRLSARRQCPKCKEVYNLDIRPPETEGKCDLCDTPLFQRQDDRFEVLQERLKIYEKQTAPVLDFYRDRSGFHRIDGAQDIERVYAEVVSYLQAHDSRAF